jgi:hypothetical protein
MQKSSTNRAFALIKQAPKKNFLASIPQHPHFGWIDVCAATADSCNTGERAMYQRYSLSSNILDRRINLNQSGNRRSYDTPASLDGLQVRELTMAEWQTAVAEQIERVGSGAMKATVGKSLPGPR